MGNCVSPTKHGHQSSKSFDGKQRPIRNKENRESSSSFEKPLKERSHTERRKNRLSAKLE